MSVMEIVHLILELMGKTFLDPKVLHEATLEIPKQYLDCSKARQMLGWQPKGTLEEGLRETIAWYKKWLAKTVD